MRASSYLIYYALDRETRGLDGYCTGSSEHKEGSSRLHYPLVASYRDAADVLILSLPACSTCCSGTLNPDCLLDCLKLGFNSAAASVTRLVHLSFCSLSMISCSSSPHSLSWIVICMSISSFSRRLACCRVLGASFICLPCVASIRFCHLSPTGKTVSVSLSRRSVRK